MKFDFFRIQTPIKISAPSFIIMILDHLAQSPFLYSANNSLNISNFFASMKIF